MTAFGRALTAFVLLVLLFVAGGGLLSVRFFQDAQSQTQVETFRRLATGLGTNIESGLALGLPLEELPGLQGLLERTRRLAPSVSAITVYDVGGEVRFSTNPSDVGWKTQWPSGTALEQDAQIVLDREDELVVIQPIHGAFGENVGAVSLRVPQVQAREDNHVALMQLARNIVAIGCVALLVAGLTGLAEAWRRARRLGLLRASLIGALDGGAVPDWLDPLSRRIMALRARTEGEVIPVAAERPATSVAPLRELARARSLRLGVALLTILAAAGGALVWTVYQQMERSVPPLITERARLTGYSIVGQIERALSFGIPFDRLVGVEPLLAAAVEAEDGFIRAEVAAPDGRVLYSYTDPHMPDQVENAERFSLAIVAGGRNVGSLKVARTRDVTGSMLLPLLRNLALLALAILLIGLEAVALGLMRLGNLSLAAVYRVAALAGAGDFRFLAAPGPDDDAISVVAAVNAVIRWARGQMGLEGEGERLAVRDLPQRRRLCLFGLCVGLVPLSLSSWQMLAAGRSDQTPFLLLALVPGIAAALLLLRGLWGVLPWWELARTLLLAMLAGAILCLCLGPTLGPQGLALLGVGLGLLGGLPLLAARDRTTGAA
ncbi:hypothetical protein [Niveispirillum sp. KHB5.9]|uniref:hypothetical protein n=1 Tax=Niveispirillum sp. KHB5.9 TaxID=3400269 RepID=UPI003A83A8A2